MTKMRFYTRTGDSGFTSTMSGDRVPKDYCLIQLNGEIDELQTQIDKIESLLKTEKVFVDSIPHMERIQTLLWQLGGEVSLGKELATPITTKDIDDLEKWIEEFKLDVHGFQRFSKHVAIEANEARVRTRKLERTLTDYLREKKIRLEVYIYMNRLSAYFFALAVAIQQQ